MCLTALKNSLVLGNCQPIISTPSSGLSLAFHLHLSLSLSSSVFVASLSPSVSLPFSFTLEALIFSSHKHTLTLTQPHPLPFHFTHFLSLCTTNIVLPPFPKKSCCCRLVPFFSSLSSGKMSVMMAEWVNVHIYSCAFFRDCPEPYSEESVSHPWCSVWIGLWRKMMSSWRPTQEQRRLCKWIWMPVQIRMMEALRDISITVQIDNYVSMLMNKMNLECPFKCTHTRVSTRALKTIQSGRPQSLPPYEYLSFQKAWSISARYNSKLHSLHPLPIHAPHHAYINPEICFSSAVHLHRRLCFWFHSAFLRVSCCLLPLVQRKSFRLMAPWRKGLFGSSWISEYR